MGSEVLFSGMEKMSWGFEAPASYLPFSNWLVESRRSGMWTLEENKIFEKALAFFDTESPEKWQKIAKMIPGKSVEELKRHYRYLEEDVSQIEAGLIPIPGYSSSSFTLEWVDGRGGFDGLKQPFGAGGRRTGARTYDQERKKGIPWTEEEHRLFLMGLKKYGKGDWRNISRNFVTSRTPTQVASHAQKYFLRLSSGGKDKRRSSIHDITTANLTDNTTHSCSQTSVLPKRPGSVVSSESTDQFSVITDSSQSKEAAGMAFDPTLSWANSNLFTHNSHGIGPVRVKLEFQSSQTGNLRECVVGDHQMFCCDIPS